MERLIIPQFSHKAAQAAQARLDSLAKVPGSLGALEDLVIKLAGITDKECPSFPKKALVLFAADHDNHVAAGFELVENLTADAAGPGVSFVRGDGDFCEFSCAVCDGI